MLAMILLIFMVVVFIIIHHGVMEMGKNYEIEKVNQYNYFRLKQNDSYGVIDKKGSVIVKPMYSEIIIPNPEKDVFVCYQGEDINILNKEQEEILTEYSHVQQIRLKNVSSDLMYEKSVLKYSKEGKYGLVGLEGKEITKPIYEEIDSLPYKEGELLVKQNGKYGIINIKGNSIVPIQYDKVAVDEFYMNEEGYRYAGYIVSIKTQDGYRYGYLNSKGKEVLPIEYNEISRVVEIKESENVYLICAKNGQYGVRKNGDELLENGYQSIRYDAINQIFVMEKNQKYGIADFVGKQIVPIEYNQIDITGMFLYAQNEQGTTVYHANGVQANISANVAILNTNNEKYKIKINHRDNQTQYGVMDKEGKQLIEEKYNYIEYLHDNYFIASEENGKLGVLDDKGIVKIEIDKDSVQKIQDTDLIQTTYSSGKIMQIYNKDMEMIGEMQNGIMEVKDHYIKMYNGIEVKYFNQQGKELKNIEVYPNNQLFVKKQGEQYGFVDANGKLVVDYQYDQAEEFNIYGFAGVKKAGKWGVLNEQGQEVVAPIYEMKERQIPFFIGSYYRVTYGFGEFYYTN